MSDGETADHPLDAPEVSEKTIADLINADTRELLNAELDKIIEEVRAHRHLWEQEENSSRKAGRKPNPAKGLKLDDLKLDL